MAFLKVDGYPLNVLLVVIPGEAAVTIPFHNQPRSNDLTKAIKLHFIGEVLSNMYIYISTEIHNNAY